MKDTCNVDNVQFLNKIANKENKTFVENPQMTRSQMLRIGTFQVFKSDEVPGGNSSEQSGPVRATKVSHPLVYQR